MINIKQTVATCASVIGIAAGTMLAFPATASAATYGGQCGGGYNVIDSHNLKTGTVFLTYNGDQNCVVTVRNQPGAKQIIGAWLILSGVRPIVGGIEQHEYTTYAGPLYVHAKGHCIDWGGMLQDGDNWTAKNVHCG
ncbi:spore-associated protein A [Nocardia testacea]|uniref:spore-associated protein A n=1 Tax=Nocardia testacea TaxID=248551 RepID=UPI0034093E17